MQEKKCRGASIFFNVNLHLEYGPFIPISLGSLLWAHLEYNGNGLTISSDPNIMLLFL